jgi:hypothetical protein
MNRRPPALFFLLLALAALACARPTLPSLPGLGDDPTATATINANATPTLAPTGTPDAAATTLAQSVAEEATASAEAEGGTPGAEGESTPGSSGNGNGQGENGNGDNGGNGGDNGGNGDNGDNGSNGGDNGQASAGCPAGGTNLLLNPSFEGPYEPYASIGELNHAAEWIPFWFDGQNNLRPEFKPATLAVDSRRVHSGETAQQYFKSHGQFKSGVYQVVFDVPLNVTLQFSIFGQAWSCDDTANCPGPQPLSANPSNPFMRVGIDPLGGSNAFSADVIWSPYFHPLDQWQVACVTAESRRDIVTVFAWASPDGPRQNQDIYWDDAALVVVP